MTTRIVIVLAGRSAPGASPAALTAPTPALPEASQKSQVAKDPPPASPSQGARILSCG